MNIWQLAWRNLARNRRRSLATLAAMVLGIVTVLLFGGYVNVIRLGLETGFVQAGGHLQVQHRDYFLYGNGNPAAYGIRDYRRLAGKLHEDAELGPLLAEIAPRLDMGGIAGNFAAGVSRTVIGVGLDSKAQARMQHWNGYGMDRMEGKPPALDGTAADAAVIGTGVARVLQLCAPLQVADCPQPLADGQSKGAAMPADLAGLDAAKQGRKPQADSHIELLAATASGAPNIASLNVVKAENFGVKALDDMMIQLHLPKAQQLLFGSGAPQVSSLILQLKDSRDLERARKRVQQLLMTESQPLSVLDFAKLNPQYGQITGMFAAILGFVGVLIGTIVLFTVGNTMAMVVVERTSEIGTLRALGLRQQGIRRLFVCEGLLLGLLAAIAGTALALLLASLINHAGLSWLPPGNSEPVPLAVLLWGQSGLLLGMAVLLTLLAVLSAWWPARRASKLNIVEALRHA